MLAQSDRAAWKRLGILLEQRRVEMDPRYHNRSLFCDERGIDYRLTYDIESAARTNFRRQTLRAIEAAYGLEFGAIDAVLGGDAGLAVRPAQPERDSDAEIIRRFFEVVGERHRQPRAREERKRAGGAA